MYSHAWRGREHRQRISTTEHDQTVLPEEENTSPRSSRRRRMWAILLQRVWDIDALKCPSCGGRMRVTSVMERPAVIRRILEHLDLWVEEEPRPTPVPLKPVFDPDADYVTWRDDVPEIEAG